MLQTPQQAAAWLHSQIKGSLRTDSRALLPGDGFLAWPGAATDARAYVKSALQAGALAALVEHDGMQAFSLDDPRVASYAGLKAAAGPIAAEYFGHPSKQLSVLAVTGTNGKTSTAWWLAQALSALPGALAQPCGLIGTLGVGRPPDHLVATGLTTPDPVLLQQALRDFVDAGMRACAIEASSIGLEEQRLAGTDIRVALFTNFTQDHLDYHGDMQAYWESKRRLFDWPGLQSAVVNIDDAHGERLAAELDSSSLDLWTVAIDQPARLRARQIAYHADGLQFELQEGDDCHLVQVPLLGAFNVVNLLGVAAAMRCLNVPLEQVAQALRGLRSVPGRMECLSAPAAPLVAVDYAHTPDALVSALRALRPVAQQRGGRLWCVFGCGGARDVGKRPLMGAVAAQLADRVVLTNDNPRNERPEDIIAQIRDGMPADQQPWVESDRAEAIRLVIHSATRDDVVLLAGKGHELTQETGSVKLPFSDREQVLLGFAALVMAPLERVVPWLAGAKLVGDGATPFARVHTDTRSIAPGDLFVALRGERFDANTLLHEAKSRGAAAVLCLSGLDAQLYPADLPRIEVADTRLALGQLAAGWRSQFSLPLIAVTGSNGKTTVTQMLASILEAHAPAGASLATRGNLNNEIGVPLTVLRLRSWHRIAVVELGMNHPGEIAALAAIAKPTVALVNNAQREHLEFMQTVRAVAQENGTVISALPADGVAVFPADDEYTALWEALASPRKTARFGSNIHQTPEAQDVGLVSASWVDGAWNVQASARQTVFSLQLHIAGRHNIRNALAATQCALAAGVGLSAIQNGLQAFRPVTGRSNAMSFRSGARTITLVDDTYNANPDSVRAAIEVLRELPGPRLLILGDMGEVGQQGPAFHEEAGSQARQAGIEHMLCIGELATHCLKGNPGAKHFASVETLIATAQQRLPDVASVLVKGSRFMRMERVVAAIKTALTAAPAPVSREGVGSISAESKREGESKCY